MQMRFLLTILFVPLTAMAVKKGGEFKFNIRVNPEILNPITAHDNYSLQTLHWMVESLLAYDEDTYKWVPTLATKYAVSKDGLTYTFDLREGVHFHDGSEMTAEDVAFSFEVRKSALYGATAQREDLNIFDKIEVLGKYQIRFHAKSPMFSHLQTLALLTIVPKKIYGDSARIPKLTDTVIGTGPYRLKEYHRGMRLILEANPDWWGRNLPENTNRYNFDRIIVRFVEDENLRVQMLEKGDLDYADLSLKVVQSRTKDKPWGQKAFVEKARHLGFYTTQSSLFINLRKPLFAGLKTRQALQLLLNRKLIKEKFRGGTGLEATGPWHRLSEYADSTVKPVEFDPDKAARLLKEDGWKDEDANGVLEKVIAGKKTEFRFLFIFPVRDQEAMLSVYQDQLKHAGIDMRLQQADWSLFLQKVDTGDFDGYIVGRGWPEVIDFNPKYEWNSRFANLGGNNAIGYKNKQVDKLMDQAEVEMDRDKRIRLLKKAYKLIAQDQSQIFTFSEEEIYYGRTARLKVGVPNRKYLLGINNWWLE